MGIFGAVKSKILNRKERRERPQSTQRVGLLRDYP
jgi:hypothetical protein